MAGSKSNARSASSPRLIPAKQASKQLGIPYSSLRDAHHRGEIAVVRIGSGSNRAWYFETSELERWVESRREMAERP